MESAAPNEMPIDVLIANIIRDLKSNQLKLPVIPDIAIRVRNAVESEDKSAADIAKIISAGISLSTRLLQVANSPMYRGSKEIDTVQMAVALLGNKVVRGVVMSLVMKDMFQSDSPLLKKRMQDLWQHSIHVAAISQVFAKKFTNLDPEQAMLAGLIHDIGMLPIIAAADKYEGLANNEGLLEVVLQQLHTSVGKLVLESWKFSKELIHSTAGHENLSYQSEQPDYLDIVIVANLHTYIGTSHRHAAAEWSTLPSFAKLGLDADKSVAVIEEAKDEIAEMRKLLSG